MTDAGRRLLERGELVNPDLIYPGIAVRMIATATVREGIAAVEREAERRGREQGALAVARAFDEDAFLCDFGGRRSVNLPNLDQVVDLGEAPR